MKKYLKLKIKYFNLITFLNPRSKSVIKYLFLNFYQYYYLLILKYPEAILERYCIHFIKALWEKSKRLGICNKKTINDTKIIIYGFKIYPFIKEKKRDKYLEEIKDNILKIIIKIKNINIYISLNIGKIQIFYILKELMIMK